METPLFKTNIAILGAGLGGYETFRSLAKQLKKTGLSHTITLIDAHTYFTFAPMLHEVASGSIEPSHCTFSLREIVAETPHTFLNATIEHLDPTKKEIITSRGTVSYDYVVVALGSTVNYFNTPGADTFCYSVRTLPKVLRLRKKIVALLESGISTLALTIVGGGYTGIELAAQLQYLALHDLKKLYPHTKLTITVLEGTSTILNNLPTSVQINVKTNLEKQGVLFRLNEQAKEVREKSLLLANGQELPSDVTIWCAGVENVAGRFLSETWHEKGRINVNEFLHHPLDSTLYAVGDIARFSNQNSPQPCPQLGQVAARQGQFVAKHLIATLQKKSIAPFHFTLKGMLIPIGDWYGVFIMGNIVLFGRLAWWLRRTVYVRSMPGFARKIRIILDWTLRSFGFRYIIDTEEN